MGRTGISGSHAGSDNSNGPDPPKKLDRENAKDGAIPSSATAAGQPVIGGGSGSTHSGNGVDSTFAGNGATNQDAETSGQDVQASAAPAAAAPTVAAATTVASPSGKEDTPAPGSTGATERSTRPYKPRFNCIEKHLNIRK